VGVRHRVCRRLGRRPRRGRRWRVSGCMGPRRRMGRCVRRCHRRVSVPVCVAVGVAVKVSVCVELGVGV
jgi:hypothetical protein